MNIITDVTKEIGAGPSMFLIGLKQLIIFFFIMVIINIPIYTILGGASTSTITDISSFFSQISVGSLDTNT
jgi:hypothetical protein